MKAEFWRAAHGVFEEVFDLEADEQDETIARLCGEDEELRTTVLDLLEKSAPTSSSVLDSAIDEGFVRRALQERSFEGQKIDDFEVRGILGVGGMATVLEAEQLHPKRTVALKMMRFGFTSAVARRRFEYESEVLAGLSHPGIAQIYSAGTFEDPMTGLELPYFSMEYVEGARTITNYASEEKLGLGAVLRLFLRVCRAVEYGHQRGIIHRDLKPQNILIGSDSYPKVIDFGIARAVDDAAARSQTLEARSQEILGTLLYMSPEQLSGDESAIDVRSDIHALGIILHELLSESLPVDLRGKSIAAAIEALQDATFPRLSTLHTRFGGTARLKELDCVVAKARARDREQRYDSVGELARDLEAILDDRAITARAPSLSYHARVFVRRHRVLVAACFLVLVSLVSAVFVMTNSLAKVREESEARRVVGVFFRRLLASANPNQDGKDVKVVTLLDATVKNIDELYEGRPRLKVILRTTLGEAYFGLGQHQKAKAMYEQALDIAHGQLDAMDGVTLSLRHDLGAVWFELGDFQKAKGHAEFAHQGRVETLGAQNPETAKSMVLVGLVRFRLRDFDAAGEAFEEAISTLSKADPKPWRPLVQATGNLGMVHLSKGRGEEAVESFRKAIKMGTEQFGESDLSVLSNLGHLGLYYLRAGQYQKAADAFRTVLRSHERVLGPENPATLLTLNNVVSCLQKLGDSEAAEKGYLDLLARRKKAGIYKHYLTGIALGNLAVCLESQGKLKDADARFAECFAMLEGCGISKQHWIHANFKKGLGVLRRKQERYAESEELLTSCLRVLEASKRDQSVRIRLAREALVATYEAWGKPKRAETERKKLADG